MAIIKPFKGYIPADKYVDKVPSLPYDVMSSDEAREMAKDNPYSFLRVVRPEINFPKGIDMYSREVYDKGAEILKKFIEDGVLIRSEKPSFYVYRQKMGDVVQTGLVAGASLEEYEKGLIKRHEFTRKEKEEDRVNHINILNANTGPGFLTYKHRDTINNIIDSITSKDPKIDLVTGDGVEHILWCVDDDKKIEGLINEFSKINFLYIADGHHRTAASARVYKMRKNVNLNHTGEESYNYYLAVIFPDNDLYVMAYNRVLKNTNGYSTEEIMHKIADKFNIIELKVSDPEDAKPDRRGEFSMYIDGKWYKLVPKSGVIPDNDIVNSLDVAVLQNNILQPIFGINDPRTSNDIDFIGGIRGLKELVRRCNEDYKVAFALYPTGIDQLIAVADAGKVMPPKSTWFEPKLRSGLVVRTLD